jgi:hypothetical protein
MTCWIVLFVRSLVSLLLVSSSWKRFHFTVLVYTEGLPFSDTGWSSHLHQRRAHVVAARPPSASCSKRCEHFGPSWLATSRASIVGCSTTSAMLERAQRRALHTMTPTFSAARFVAWLCPRQLEGFAWATSSMVLSACIASIPRLRLWGSKLGCCAGHAVEREELGRRDVPFCASRCTTMWKGWRQRCASCISHTQEMQVFARSLCCQRVCGRGANRVRTLV